MTILTADTTTAEFKLRPEVATEFIQIFEGFFDDAVSTTEPGFVINRQRQSISITPTRLGQHFNIVENVLRQVSFELMDSYHLTPKISIFLKTLSSINYKFGQIHFVGKNDKLEAEYFNEFIEKLRQNSKLYSTQDEVKHD